MPEATPKKQPNLAYVAWRMLRREGVNAFICAVSYLHLSMAAFLAVKYYRLDGPIRLENMLALLLMIFLWTVSAPTILKLNGMKWISTSLYYKEFRENGFVVADGKRISLLDNSTTEAVMGFFFCVAFGLGFYYAAYDGLSWVIGGDPIFSKGNAEELALFQRLFLNIGIFSYLIFVFIAGWIRTSDRFVRFSFPRLYRNFSPL